MGPKARATELRKQIRCKKIFGVPGNHDKDTRKLIQEFSWLNDLAEVSLNGQRIVLCHYAMRVWNQSSHRHAWHLYGHSHGRLVSAGAKIPIVPVEFSPPLNVVHRSPLHTEEVPKLVKGERRARTERTATARNEHPGHQQVDRLGPQDDSQVHAGGRVGTGVWPTLSTAEQARCV